MKSLLQSLNESSEAVLNNYDANFTINELANIQGSFGVLESSIEYFAEAVPVFIKENNGAKVYCIESDNLKKLMKSQDINEACALDQIYDALIKEGNEMKKSDMAIVVENQDINVLYKTVVSDPTKLDARCEQVEAYNSYLKNIIAEGVQILLN